MPKSLFPPLEEKGFEAFFSLAITSYSLLFAAAWHILAHFWTILELELFLISCFSLDQLLFLVFFVHLEVLNKVGNSWNRFGFWVSLEAVFLVRSAPHSRSQSKSSAFS